MEASGEFHVYLIPRGEYELIHKGTSQLDAETFAEAWNQQERTHPSGYVAIADVHQICTECDC